MFEQIAVEQLGYLVPIVVFWFFIYWILGGVVFAVISFLRTTKLRKVRFSCLFTIASGLAAIGASYGGMLLGQNEIQTCLANSTDFLGAVSSVIGCGILSLFLAGGIGFAGLIVVGLFLLYISRAANQSWVDSDEGVREETHLVFDLE